MIFVDLSSVNPHPVDFAELRGAGVGGAVIKATEGTSYVNPYFGIDYWSAVGAALTVGAYLFWHPEEADAAQLAWFKSHYGPRAGDFPPIVDAEINPSGLAWSELRDRLGAMLDNLAASYGDAWAYMDRSWAAAIDLQGHGVWLAQGSPGPVEAAIAQQFAPALIPGVTAPVDWSVTDWRP